MSDAEHTPPRDLSFRRSLLRNIAGAVGLVVLVAALFAVLGMIGRADDGDPDLAIDDVPEDGVGETDGDLDEDADAPVADPDAPSDDDAPVADPDAPVDGGAAEDDPAETTDGDTQPDDGSSDDGSSGSGQDDASGDGDDAEDDAEPDEPASDIDPGEISVQVLDGFGQDGGTAATAVAERLEAAGYQIVARNPAIAYEVTTVLWTDGSEDAARQVATEIDAAAVREQPGNLSTDVDVHVVVGADRG